jgi:dolichol-phosphate mannosyltransferase
MNNIISLIVPTYNEHENIAPLAARIHQALQGQSYQILFVDDNSSDGTIDIINTLASEYPVKLLLRKEKKGLASAVIDGINASQGNIVGTINADLQHPPETLTGMIKEIEEGADIAVASRYLAGGGCRDWGWMRRTISKAATSIAHLFLPLTRLTTDPMSGFYLLQRKTIDNVELQATGYKTLIEILLKGNFQKVADVPYTFNIRTSGRSKLGVRQNLDYLRQIFRLMWQTGEVLRFAKFLLVGLSGTLINTGLLWLLTEYAGLFYIVSSGIAIELAIISNFVMNNFFTFSDRRSSRLSVFFLRLLNYNLISLIGLGINIGLLWLLTEIAGIYYLISQILGIICVTLFRYVLNLRWTWR